jgi:hypothetical protein
MMMMVVVMIYVCKTHVQPSPGFFFSLLKPNIPVSVIFPEWQQTNFQSYKTINHDVEFDN